MAGPSIPLDYAARLLSSTRARGRQWLTALTGIGLGALFMWLSLRTTDLHDIRSLILGSDLRLAVPVCGALAGSYWIKTVRWAVLLRPLRRLSAESLFPLVMIGYLGNTVLPVQLGEVARIGLMRTQYGLAAAPVLATIVVERVFDLLTVAVFFLVAVFVLGEFGPVTDGIGLALLGAGLAVVAGVLFFIARTSQALAFVNLVTRPLPAAARDVIVAQAALGESGLRALKDGQLTLRVIALSLLQWTLMAASVSFASIATGQAFPALAAGVVVAFTAAGMMLPSSPGFFGTIQLCFVLALEPFGVSAESAIAASVFWHVLAFSMVVVLGGLYWIRISFSRAPADPSGPS